MARWDYEDTDPRGTKHDAETEQADLDGMMCPQCYAIMHRRHHDGSWRAPECWWWECDECEYKTEPK